MKKQKSIINRAGLKKFIFAQVKEVRPGWECKRISPEALNQIEIFLKEKVKHSISMQPTLGKTYKQFF